MSGWAYKKCPTCGDDVHIGFLCSTCGDDPQKVIDRQYEFEKAARARLAEALKQVERARIEVEENMENRVSLQARARCIRDMYIKKQVTQ